MKVFPWKENDYDYNSRHKIFLFLSTTGVLRALPDTWSMLRRRWAMCHCAYVTVLFTWVYQLSCLPRLHTSRSHFLISLACPRMFSTFLRCRFVWSSSSDDFLDLSRHPQALQAQPRGRKWQMDQEGDHLYYNAYIRRFQLFSMNGDPMVGLLWGGSLWFSADVWHPI